MPDIKEILNAKREELVAIRDNASKDLVAKHDELIKAHGEQLDAIINEKIEKLTSAIAALQDINDLVEMPMSSMIRMSKHFFVDTIPGFIIGDVVTGGVGAGVTIGAPQAISASRVMKLGYFIDTTKTNRIVGNVNLDADPKKEYTVIIAVIEKDKK